MYQRKELFRVGIIHANTTMRNCAADILRRVGAMDAIARIIEPHPSSTKRAGFGKNFFVNNMPVAYRRGSMTFSDGYGKTVKQMIVFI